MVSESIARKVLALLNEKSATARAIAKQSILEKQMGIGKVDKAVEQYLSKWNDTTRPGVLALAFEAVGGNQEEVVPLQAALLFIDATMDVHDDIIDESVTKKRRKTVYGKLGKEATLLVGDVFMVEGFNYLHKALGNLSKDLRLMVMDRIEDFLSEVVEAHILESLLKAKKCRLRPEIYLQILTKKAADIEGHMKVGAIYGGGSAREIEALSKYGRNIGVLLAVRTDFVDVFEPTELIHRLRYEVLPLPVLYALRNRKKGKRIREILKRDCLSKEDCNELIELVYDTKEITLLKRHLNNLKKEALLELRFLANSQAKDALRLLAAFMMEDL
jgi:geranylgeranyl pyrophosphate synthase